MRPAELRQQVDIETPEHVAVRLELAGVGSRAAAALVDTLIVVVLLVLLQFAGGADERPANRRSASASSWKRATP